MSHSTFMDTDRISGQTEEARNQGLLRRHVGTGPVASRHGEGYAGKGGEGHPVMFLAEYLICG